MAIAAAAAALTVATAPAGEPVDPNLGDSVIGKQGGLRYAKDAQVFNELNGYAFPEAGCGPPRFHVIGGGGELVGGGGGRRMAVTRPLDYNDADFELDDLWAVSGFGGAGGRAVAYSICTTEDNLRHINQDVDGSPTGSRVSRVSCGGGRWHAAGGGAFIATTGSFINSTHPYDGPDRDRRPDDGWKGRMLDTLGGNGGAEMYVICRRGGGLSYRSASEGGLGAGENGVVSASCGPDRHVTGGGVRVSGSTNGGAVLATKPLDRGDRDDVPDDGWRGAARNISGTPTRITTYAICLS